MKCPGCKHEMTAVKVNDVEVDVCKGGCGGIWFDKDELDKFDEESEFEGGLLLDVEQNPSTKVDQTALRRCPRCPAETLVRQFYDVENKIQINQCWECTGIFLDPGELKAIRSSYKTAKDRQAAAEQYAARIIDEQETEMNEETKEEIAEENEETSGAFKAFLFGFKQLWRGGK